MGALLTRYPAGHLLSTKEGAGQGTQLEVYSTASEPSGSDWSYLFVFYELRDDYSVDLC